jgi:hypothetical protein
MGRSFIGLIICIGFASALKIGLTPREKYAIVKEHNRDRSKDASEGSDSASTMRKMAVSSTNKTDRHDITEILFKVALNTINHKPNHTLLFTNLTIFLIVDAESEPSEASLLLSLLCSFTRWDNN